MTSHTSSEEMESECASDLTQNATPPTPLVSPAFVGNEASEYLRQPQPSRSLEPLSTSQSRGNVRFCSPFQEQSRAPSAAPVEMTIQQSRDGDGEKGQLQRDYQALEEINLVRERLVSLESRLQGLDTPRGNPLSEKGDEWSDRSPLSTEPRWMTWQEYLDPVGKATSILEVLVQKPHTSSRRKSVVAQPGLETASTVPSIIAPRTTRRIERIRVRSPHIIVALQAVSEQTFANFSCQTIHRPFKILVVYKDAIEDYLHELEQKYSNYPRLHRGRPAPDFADSAKDLSSSPEVNQENEFAEEGVFQGMDDDQTWDFEGFQNSKIKREESMQDGLEDLSSQKEAISHLQALVAFMNKDMKHVFEQHRLLRSSDATKVYYRDLWHLFGAGDFVVTDEKVNPRLYIVSILPACDLFSSRREVKRIEMRSEGAQQQVESVYTAETVNMLNIDVFYFAFNGQSFGPVEARFTILHFEGEKDITDLPLYPLRFRKDGDALKAMLRERGKKFVGLSSIAHREYSGLSAVEPKEQVSHLFEFPKS